MQLTRVGDTPGVLFKSRCRFAGDPPSPSSPAMKGLTGETLREEVR